MCEDNCNLIGSFSLQVVNDSCEGNQAALVGDQSGKVLIPQYNWSDFLVGVKMHGIKEKQQFSFKSEKPGEFGNNCTNYERLGYVMTRFKQIKLHYYYLLLLYSFSIST